MLNLFTVLLTVNVHAQTNEGIDISQGDQFTWEIKEFNLHNFEKVFGVDPGFNEGDQIRIRVTDVVETSYGWNIVTEFFDYGSDFTKDGTVKTFSLDKSPEEYADNIFIPTPTEDYLEEASEILPNEYTIRGNKIIKRKSEYTLEMEYNTQGVKSSVTIEDKNGIVLVRLEGLFTIPMGNYFIGFMALSVVGLIAGIIKKKAISVSNSE
ncbi:MAG: hypothetical protein R6U96_06780 [Promethearchaeia archaeon]